MTVPQEGALAFAVAVALTIGGGVGVVRASQRSGRIATVALLVFLTLAAATALVPSGITAVAVLLGVLVSAAGLILRTPADGTEHRDSLVLAPDLMARQKRDGDYWVLILGPAGSAKSSFIDATLQTGLERRSVESSPLGPARSGNAGSSRVTEWPVRVGDRLVTLRFWEVDTLTGVGKRPTPPMAEFDAVVVATDPTRVLGLAESLPEALRGQPLYDATQLLLAALEAVAAVPHPPVVWAIVTKADLLRFSVAPSLVSSMHVGAGWYRQLKDLNVVQRAQLLRSMGLAALADRQPGVESGGGSPLMTFTEKGIPTMPPFGTFEFIDAVLARAI